MPKIKLFKVYPKYDYDSMESYLSQTDLSDWEEVTEEELNILQTFIGYDYLKNKDLFMAVWEEVKSNVIHDYVKDISAYINKIKKETEEMHQKLKAEREEREKKEEQKKIEQAKKLLKQNGIDVE